MNQDLMVRLFRSIEGDHDDDIVKIAKKIIEDEKQKGHQKLASKLLGLLEKNVESHISFRKELKTLLPASTFIPSDKRNNIPLASLVDKQNLRHEMVLSKIIESQIQRIGKGICRSRSACQFWIKATGRKSFFMEHLVAEKV